jgi:hypothetical protein
VNWNPPAWNSVGASGTDQQTSDVSGIIQEIVDQIAYSQGNSMVFTISGTGVRTAESYDGSSSNSAQLCIEYFECSGPGIACDDRDNCTTGDVYDSNCSCSGTPVADSDNDGVCDADDQCPGTDDALIGTACEDGDACTIGETYDANCNCSGGTIQDTDNDGVCDADDVCPGGDDTVDNNNNGTPDDCEGCTYTVINTEGFENGWGIWNDGGRDCARRTDSPNTGSYAIRIRDNSGTSSSFTTDNLDLSSYEEITIDFSFLAISMEKGEDFWLRVSTDAGRSYTTVADYSSGVEFNDNVRYDESVVIDNINFTSTTRFRFTCDASGNNDKVHIDDVVIRGCGEVQARLTSGGDNKVVTDRLPDTVERSFQEEVGIVLDVKAYPNPFDAKLTVQFNRELTQKGILRICDTNGKEVYRKDLVPATRSLKVNSANLPGGVYFLQVVSGDKTITKKLVRM